MSGYTILRIFCSFMAFLVLLSGVFCEEVILKVDVQLLLISLLLKLNLAGFKKNGFFLLDIAVSYFECSRILPVCFYVGWYNACRKKTDRGN